MKTLFVSVVVFVWLVCLTESSEDWTPEFLSQTRKKSCILGNIEHDVTFLHGTDSGDFQKLGKVADMEVCVLLCCEMDNCEAAFMADRNCYAVKCHSQEHCVTAPARKNKWHPLVVFVKRISQSNKDKGSKTAQPQNNKSGTSKEHVQQEISAVHKDVNLRISQSKDDKESQTAQAQNKHSGASKEHAQKEKSAVQKNVNLQVDQSNVKESQAAHAQNKQSGTPKKHALKEMNATKKEFKDSQIPGSPSDKVEANGIMNSLTIPVEGKPSVIRLEQEDTTKRKTIPLEGKMKIRDDMFKKSKSSLISAAILTCSMAVVLSGVAVIAAKIRKRREAHHDPEYSSVPTAEE